MLLCLICLSSFSSHKICHLSKVGHVLLCSESPVATYLELHALCHVKGVVVQGKEEGNHVEFTVLPKVTSLPSKSYTRDFHSSDLSLLTGLSRTNLDM